VTGGRGIACAATSLTCTTLLGTSNGNFYAIQMVGNTDTYLYSCGGLSASSTVNQNSAWPKVAHRMWVRKSVGL